MSVDDVSDIVNLTPSATSQ